MHAVVDEYFTGYPEFPIRSWFLKGFSFFSYGLFFLFQICVCNPKVEIFPSNWEIENNSLSQKSWSRPDLFTPPPLSPSQMKMPNEESLVNKHFCSGTAGAAADSPCIVHCLQPGGGGGLWVWNFPCASVLNSVVNVAPCHHNDKWSTALVYPLM